MGKKGAITGFPEWLPAQKLVEERVLADVRRTFESFGFTPLETRAVEPIDVLTNQGSTDKEIYVLRRLHAEEGDKSEFGLHFDLTVPFARYVGQNRGRLAFPFKRYQIQKVWRGERPAAGRYREFYQADIDVVGDGELPLHFDAEMALVLHDVMESLPVPPVQIRVNNRKVLEGFYRALGIEAVTDVLRTVDKLDKIGDEAVARSLVDDNGLSAGQAESCLKLAAIRGTGAGVVDEVRALGEKHELLDTGLEELGFVMGALEGLREGSVLADLHIARGLAYYTGTVYEGYLQGHDGFGAVCAGGRYDNLAAGGGALPGVGVSVGITRLLGKLFADEALKPSRPSPTAVLVSLASAEDRPRCYEVARQLRSRGVPTEVFHAPQKFGKQIRYAERRGIPYVLFLGEDGAEVRDIRVGEQSNVDLASWSPPAADLAVTVVRSSE